LSLIGTNCKRATRPCRCGYLGHPSGRCRCTPDQIRHYRARISGPLLDRIDLQVEVPALSEHDVLSAPAGEASALVRERVAHARTAQLARQGVANARLSSSQLARHAPVDAGAESLLREAIARWQLSARALQRVRKVARTIADLARSPEVRPDDIAEAIGYRGAWR
jgi:magnesium chelatase family protein